MKLLRTISRILIGCLFIFSGFVKGVDPLGTQYRIEDYFIAYHMNWAIPSALYLSMFLCMFEFLMGVLVLLNVRLRLVSWLVMLMMIFFTITTFYDALKNPVPDCGCFGDAIKLTNWQTFWKNIVIMVFVIIWFSGRNIIRPTFTAKGEFIIAILFIMLFIGFEEYNLMHLPVIDFSKWKIGSKLAPDNPKPLQYYVTYKNKETGEQKEYLSPHYPYNDSIWMSHWKFASQRVVNPNQTYVQITIEDKDRNNVTETILRNPDYQFIVIAYDLNKTNVKSFSYINDLHKQLKAAGHSLIIFTASLPETVDKFIKDNNIDTDIDFYYVDDTTLMPIVRANPGMLLTKNAIVLGKWHYNDFPEYNKLKDKFNL